MSQQAIKIGQQSIRDTLDEDKLETVADVTSLDATVNGLTGNVEVCRIIIADNASLDPKNIDALIYAVREILTTRRITEIVQTP